MRIRFGIAFNRLSKFVISTYTGRFGNASTIKFGERQVVIQLRQRCRPQHVRINMILFGSLHVMLDITRVPLVCQCSFRLQFRS